MFLPMHKTGFRENSTKVTEQTEEENLKGPTNEPTKEQKSLEELRHKESIVITNADKGGAVVILNVKEFIKESERQLSDSKHYRHLEHDPTTVNNAIVSKVMTIFKIDKLISSTVLDGRKVKYPRTTRIYMQPKIHKKGNLGMPVVSSLNCHTSRISEYVDLHLQQIVKQIPSYMKDAPDILCKLEAIKSVPDNAYFVSLDVKLHTSIPNAKRIKTVKVTFDKHTSKNVVTKVITTFLALILI